MADKKLTALWRKNVTRQAAPELPCRVFSEFRELASAFRWLVFVWAQATHLHFQSNRLVAQATVDTI